MISVKTEFITFNEDLYLESGRIISPITVAYERYGEINDKKDNIILICHALTGSAHAAFSSDITTEKQSSGWWDKMIGSGKAFDTDKYHVICSNILGSCYGTTGPGSIDPKSNTPYGLRFPVITVRDMVKLQKRLMEYLGVTSIFAIAGGSLGGMQVLEWAITYPETAKNLIVISATTRLTPMAIAFNSIARQAIKSDPNYNNGDYYGNLAPRDGLAIARMAGHITYLSDMAFHKKFGRRLASQDSIYDFDSMYEVENYLVYNGYKFTDRFDANSYLYLLKAMDIFNLSYGYGSLDEAIAEINPASRVLLLDFTSDFLFPKYQADEIHNIMLAKDINVSRASIVADYGHDSFLIEVDEQTEAVKSFLEDSK